MGLRELTRKSKTDRHERWLRTATISSLRARVSTLAGGRTGVEPEIETQCTLHLIGVLDEKVPGVRDKDSRLPGGQVTVGTAKPASVGGDNRFPTLLARPGVVQSSRVRLCVVPRNEPPP